MSGGHSLAVGWCWACNRKMVFDPDSVPTVLVDPITGLPPDKDDALAKARSRVKQVCYRCAEEAAEQAKLLGVSDIWNGNWGIPPNER